MYSKYTPCYVHLLYIPACICRAHRPAGFADQQNVQICRWAT